MACGVYLRCSLNKAQVLNALRIQNKLQYQMGYYLWVACVKLRVCVSAAPGTALL